MSVPLWTQDNNTLDSAVFEVAAGTAVALFAVGLERDKVREDAHQVRVPQAVCISRILRDLNVESIFTKSPPVDLCNCGYVFESQWLNAIDIIEDTVRSGGTPWQLTCCNNFRILAIPGIYRLHFNDTTAIGKAQVYAEQYSLQDMPPQAAALFFQ